MDGQTASAWRRQDRAARSRIAVAGTRLRFNALSVRALLWIYAATRAIWMTALGRAAPKSAANSVLSSWEIALIARVRPNGWRNDATSSTLAGVLTALTAIGEPARTPGGWPDPFAIARGLLRLLDMKIAGQMRGSKFSERA